METEDLLVNFVRQYSKKPTIFKTIVGHQLQYLNVEDLDHNILILDQSSYHYDMIKYIERALTILPPDRFIVLSSDYSYYTQHHPNIVYFPVYLFQFLLKNPTLKHYNMQASRPYPLQCLSLNPRFHKTLNIIKLSQYPWFDKCLKSFYWADPPNCSASNQHLIDSVLPQLTQKERDIIDRLPLPIKVDLPNEPIVAGWDCVSNSSRAHANCYIDYVLESVINDHFVSEKIWKPIFSGQLFLTLGPPGLIKHLEYIGIDVFRDIIDHARYDHVMDLREKIDIILGLIDDLLCSDLEQIWHDTYQRRLHNFNLLHNPTFHQLLSQDFIDRIS